jgi:hypothetical protein
MRILYVTSFNEDMYIASGKSLVQSFIKSKMDDYLLVCYEGFSFNKRINNNKILSHNLDNSEYLQTWLKDNADVIPTYLGGQATPDKNPRVYSEWNRKTSRWFRKIASLKYALDQYSDNFDAIIWLDSDCTILQKIDKRMIKYIFNGKRVFYHLGRLRYIRGMGVESSIIGFTNKGYDILKKVINIYTTKKYKKYNRWDDGWIFREILYGSDNMDLVGTSTNNHVINQGPFNNYIQHNKGLHKQLHIMR